MRRTTARLATAMIVVPLALAGCGSSSKKAATDTANGASATTVSSGGAYGDTSTPTTATPATTVAGGGSTSGATVSLATVGKLGKVLVAADGRTLYLFEKDNGTKSACTGGCADNWPAYTSATTPKAGAGLTMTLSTATGAMANQVVYNGHLLYEFAGDSKPGDANGVGIPSWYPVTAAGTSSE